MNEFHTELKIAMAAVAEAAHFSELVREANDERNAMIKSDCSPVTMADFGVQAIVVAVDARRRGTTPETWEVFSHGGRTPEGLDAIDWCRKVCELGAGEILLTSMDRDGTGHGYDLELVRTVADAVTVPVVASGGVGELADLAAGLTEGGADAVLAASIFHYGQHTIAEAKEFLASRGIPVRPTPRT